MSTRIGVDIGGTFTDLVLYDEETGRVEIGKVPTTPASPELGSIEAVRTSVPKDIIARSRYFLHGTTVGLNALLERKGARVGLICTEGFRDTIEIRRGTRPQAYDLFWTPPAPIVPRHLRRPVHERVSAAGEVLTPLDPATVRDALNLFREEGVTAIAVCLINAYANPAHELAVADALREANFDGEISLSHRLSREYREYERTSTTCIDAFVRARMADYLDRLQTGLKQEGFAGQSLITRSGGGSMRFEEARHRSFETINSGPVAGVEGAAELARTAGLGDLVTADVGGTSFDTTVVIDGRPKLLYEGSIIDMPIQAPWIDVRSIGAGGGSIAYVDAGGLLQVGPQSAGAVPGPACYGRGGNLPTVTDCAFALGMLGSGLLASGLKLDRAAACAALAPLAGLLSSSEEEVAAGVVRIAAANMANAVREITVEQGLDPRELTLLAFGGAGPMLGCQIARELQLKSVVVPPYAGNFSAWGLLGADLIRSDSRSIRMPLDEGNWPSLEESVAALMDELEQRYSDDREFLERAGREVALSMRYKGQEHSLTLDARSDGGRLAAKPADMIALFRAAYHKSFGIWLENPIEVVAVRGTLRQPLPRKRATSAAEAAAERLEEGRHELYSFSRRGKVDARTLWRKSLRSGAPQQGPAIIYEETATTYVDEDFDFFVDEHECLHLLHRGDWS